MAGALLLCSLLPVALPSFAADFLLLFCRWRISINTTAFAGAGVELWLGLCCCAASPSGWVYGRQIGGLLQPRPSILFRRHPFCAL